MYSSFFGLEIANRALQTQQAALNVTSHNISNSNTEGYSRQIAGISTSGSLEINISGKQLSMGTGATMDNIERARDSFVDRQYRQENSQYEYWSTKQDALEMVEGLMNEPSDYSLHNDMDQFWSSWSELAKNPENVGARAVVRERALTLTETFHSIDQQITDMQNDLDSNVGVEVDKINNIADQIRELNVQIKNAEVRLDNPNDLKDERDALVDELSEFVSVRVIESQDTSFTDREVGIYKIVIGNDTDANNVLVDDQNVRHLQSPAPEESGFSRVVWEEDINGNVLGSSDSANWTDLGSNTGQLQANIEIRDEYLVGLRSQFDELAKGIAESVNKLHQTGQGLTVEGTSGIDFFVTGTTGDPFTAANINLNPVISDDLDRIASGEIPLTGTPATHEFDDDGNDLLEIGDGSVALAISSLSEGWDSLSGADPLSASSFGDYYGSVIAGMGVDVQQAERMAEGQSVLVTHMSNQKDSLSGVSLDEEMINLVKYQKSYSAAARLVTMMDSMLDQLLSMGVTR
ncbi:MAG: flagellar hook-associated protein FlgK [Eubacteriales bacterium]